MTWQQNVDHFAARPRAATFSQRYYVDDTYYQPGGPVFLYLGGEGPGEAFLMEEQMFIWAQQFNAKYILLEHRYYGNSNPTPDYTTPNMQYLTVDQALADAASFLMWYNSTLTDPSQWMIFGCSYSGCLSGWFKYKYPALTVGSYAPSGPVLAQANFTRYMGQWTDTAGPECSANVAMVVNAVNYEFAKPNGLESLSQAFNSCKPLTENDVFNFKFTLAVTIAGAAQEDLPPNFQVNQICALLNAPLPADPIQRFFNAFTFANGGPGSCNDFSDADFVAATSETSLASQAGGSRQWWWQKCTEFGYFKTSYEGTSPFFTDLPLSHFTNWCAQIFGPNVVLNTTAINEEYGALNLAASRVVITQGELDPWHNLGILKNSTTTSVYSYLYQAGHCAPLHAATPFDPPTVIGAREFVGSYISAWLASPEF
jgi:hypothetical protein